VKVKNKYWDYIESEDYLCNRMTESELKYHYGNMAFATPLYKELEYNLSNNKHYLSFVVGQRKPNSRS
jgi:predicted alternative tryptophan synthase beta-subunit